MTGQRWFLRTPAQYAAAPIGTQVWVMPEREVFWRKLADGWHLDLSRPHHVPVQSWFGGFSREVKRWGMDADHERACAAVAVMDLWLDPISLYLATR